MVERPGHRADGGGRAQGGGGAEPTGFTAVVCGAAGCDDGAVLDALRAVVRSSPQGVLVRSGCTLGPVACRLRVPGALVLVQPCDARGAPAGAAVRVGPLVTDHDRRTVARWLGGGPLDPTALPTHLTGLHRRTRAAARN